LLSSSITYPENCIVFACSLFNNAENSPDYKMSNIQMLVNIETE